MVLLFEDNVNTPSSRLLRCCHYGDNIHFANGNYNLAKEAERCVLAYAGKRKIVVDGLLCSSLAVRPEQPDNCCAD